MPDELYCVDSLDLFRKIDDNRFEAKQQQRLARSSDENESTIQDSQPIGSDVMAEITGETSINWQLLNETTPQSKKTGNGYATHLSKVWIKSN